MTAPRAREQADPPSPPERRPPRRGGGSSPYTYAASAAAALLALTGALAVPQSADAQTVATLVSNTGETVGNEVASKAAQPFTTGSAAVLASVDIRLGSSSLAGPPRVRILQDDSGSPGAELVTLVNPSSIVNEAVNNFTAPANTTLLADTTYYVELTREFDRGGGDFIYTTGRRYRVTGSDDQTGLTNWNIGDSRYFKSGSDVSWNTSSSVMMIAIKGTVVETPTLSIEGDAAASEGDGVEFTATLSATSTQAVTATWTASIESANTAVAADLTATTTDMVTVEAGDTTAKFTVPTAEDTADEENETFTVTLSGVSTNAQLAADPTAEGVIEDDDDLPELNIANASNSEEHGFITFRVTLSPASGKTVTVTYVASVETGDTATSPADFEAGTDTLTFNPGDTGVSFTLTTTDDSLDEDDETFTVTLSNPTNATISDGEAKGTITDDDETSPSCTLNTGDVWCGVLTRGNGVGGAGGNRGYVATTEIRSRRHARPLDLHLRGRQLHRQPALCRHGDLYRGIRNLPRPAQQRGPGVAPAHLQNGRQRILPRRGDRGLRPGRRRHARRASWDGTSGTRTSPGAV